MYPARPYAEYSDNLMRQAYDKRIKGTEEDVPEWLERRKEVGTYPVWENPEDSRRNIIPIYPNTM